MPLALTPCVTRVRCLHQGLPRPRGRGRLSTWRHSWPVSLQTIVVRLQGATFLALHNYLGLTTELFNPVSVLSLLTVGPQDPGL